MRCRIGSGIDSFIDHWTGARRQAKQSSPAALAVPSALLLLIPEARVRTVR